MVKQIPAVKARQQLGTLLDEVRFRGTDFIIERDGKPMAVVISPEAYGQYQKMREQAFASLDAISSKARSRWEEEGLREEDMERLIDEVVREVRAERRAHREPT